MLRTILAVVAGYIVMALGVVAAFTSMQLILGADTIYKPGSWEASSTFVTIAVVVSFVAAAIGGLVAAAIARRRTAATILAGVVVVLGVLSAVVQTGAPDPGPRPAQITPMDSAQNARQPAWYSWSLPFIGALGVVAGGAIIGRASNRVRRAA